MTMTENQRNSSTSALLYELQTGRRRVADVAQVCSARIAEIDSDIRAFIRYDPELVATRAAQLDAIDSPGPLHGLPVAVKDLVDTYDQDTGYGSPVYDGHRPIEDAEIVRRLRESGALIVGKTVTTEFALFAPGPTRNPHRLGRTPGGSSSGSAAAVAAGMVPVAIGTQTAGSVIRPASYCGVAGFKPSYGKLSCRGIKPLSPSLDTPGLLGRDVEGVRAVFEVLRVDERDQSAETAISNRLKVGIVRTRAWHRVEPDAQAAFNEVAAAASELPWVEVVNVDIDGLVAEASEDQMTLMTFEASRVLREEFEQHKGLLSDRLKSFLAEAQSHTPAEAQAAKERIERARHDLADQAQAVDILLTPATTGEAPDIESTGDPWFCRAWTALHVPAISLPLATGASGLPIGIQLVAHAGNDDLLLAAASLLQRDLLGGR